jgi:hypothetical protein
MVAGATESTASRCPIVETTAAASVAGVRRTASHTTGVTRSNILAHQCCLASSHPVFSLQAEVDARPFPRRVCHIGRGVGVPGLRIGPDPIQ